MSEFVMDNCTVNASGHLAFAGVDTIELAKEYGTPLMLLDEEKIRENARLYKNAMKKYFTGNSRPLYASKALSYKGIYRIMQEEGVGSDAVSCGEIYTAKSAGFDVSNMVFHGNNKTGDDLRYAVRVGIGRIVVDGEEELEELGKICKEQGIKQKIQLRITPGIDPHTHKAISTGRVDSKFGNAIVTGQAEKITRAALSNEGVELMGFHCHVGSQIFETEPFVSASAIMMEFIADIKKKTGFEAAELNLGGGFGVRYVKQHPYFDYEKAIEELSVKIKEQAIRYGVKMPDIMLEPGRSMVAAAGITLYTVGSVKEIPEMKNYVSIDGGMTDNPRYALYQSQYEAVIANKAAEKADYICSIAGRCCESGDLIAENIPLQKAKKGDILAVFVTGAYNYSMASNYNRLPRPAIVTVKDGKSAVAVKRESYEDLIRNDV